MFFGCPRPYIVHLSKLWIYERRDLSGDELTDQPTAGRFFDADQFLRDCAPTDEKLSPETHTRELLLPPFSAISIKVFILIIPVDKLYFVLECILCKEECSICKAFYRASMFV